MKLIRLTSSSTDGQMECNFNEDIEIGKDAKIAIQNASFSIDDKLVEIDGANREITYGVTSSQGTPQQDIIKLALAKYSKSTPEDLYKNMTKEFNTQVTYQRILAGIQYKCDVEGGKSVIQSKMFPDSEETFQTYTNGDLGKIVNPYNVPGSPNGLSITAKGEVWNNGNARAEDDRYLAVSYKEMNKCCGVFRVKIKKLDEYPTEPADNGFNIGLTDQNPADWELPDNGALTLTNDQKTFDIYVGDPGEGIDDGYDIVYKVKNGTLTNFNQQLEKTERNCTANANFIEIKINLGKITASLYRNTAGVTDPDVIFTYDLTTDYGIDGWDKPLYPYIVVNGNKSQLELVNAKIFFDPFQNESTMNSLEELYDEESDEELGVTPKVITQKGNYKHTIQFQSTSFAEELGFRTNKYEVKNRTLFLKSFNIPSLHFKNAFFIIRLQNLEVDSYDYVKGGRFNILATIPDELDSYGNVAWEAQNMIFLNLRNNNPISIRNIKAEILNADLSRPVLDGFQSVVLIIQ